MTNYQQSRDNAFTKARANIVAIVKMGGLSQDQIIDMLAHAHVEIDQYALEVEKYFNFFKNLKRAESLINSEHLNSKQKMILLDMYDAEPQKILANSIAIIKSNEAKEHRSSRKIDRNIASEKEMVKAKYFDLYLKEGKEPSAARLAGIMKHQCKAITCSEQVIGRWIRARWRAEFATTQPVKLILYC